MKTTTNINGKMVAYAYSNGRRRDGDYFNCWGATLFALGFRKKLRWVSSDEMQAWLEDNTKPIHRPQKPGDVLVVRSWGLEHTAVYLGRGKYFHKRGSNSTQITDLAGVRATYRGRYSWARVVA